MRSIILTIITISLVACSAKKGTTAESEQAEQVKKVALDMHYQLPKENGAFEINSASIEGDLLTLEVSYSGGCKEHSFTATFNGIYLKSMPPKASIFIAHETNGDACRKIVTETLVFDLTNMKYGDQKTGNTVMVGMNNYEGYLTYKY